jgi:hypothetical protein
MFSPAGRECCQGLGPTDTMNRREPVSDALWTVCRFCCLKYPAVLLATSSTEVPPFPASISLAWLYDLLQPQVEQVLVCNPRRNAFLKEGSKSDQVDARKLAELLRTGMLRPVHHGENGLRTLRELARSNPTISKDLTRVTNRLKAPVQSLTGQQ